MDKLYQNLFSLIFNLKKMQVLKSAVVLIPFSMQFHLPQQLNNLVCLRQLKLGDHSLCMLSV